MGRKSSSYQYLTSRDFIESILSYLLILYPFIFVLTKRNIGSITVSYIAVYSIFYLRWSTIIELRYLIWIGTILFGYSFLVGINNGYTIQSMMKEFYYYAKPFIFFLFGINSIKIFHESRYFKYLSLLLALGTILFYLFPTEFISASHVKSKIGEGWGHFLTFKVFLRSGSFLLSPLETSFISAFLGLYFFHNRNHFLLGWQFFQLASICLLMSMTRSVILAYFISVLFLFLSTRFALSGKWIKWILPGFLGSIILLVGLISKDYIIKNDGSIMLHFTNLDKVLTFISNNPWGYGMSSSGFISVLEGRDAMYSEGSLFTYLIECGIQSTLLFGLLGWYCLKKGVLSTTFFLFYLMVSLVLPIGFSSTFDFMFFGFLGSISNWNANRYFDYKL